MDDKTIELIYNEQFYPEEAVADLAQALSKVGADCKTYQLNAYYDWETAKSWSSIRGSQVHNWLPGPSPDFVLAISLTVAAFGAFFGGFLGEAGKDAWKAFKKKLSKSLSQKAGEPYLEIRLKADKLEIATACASEKEEVVLSFIDNAIPYLLEVIKSTKKNDFPKKEIEQVYLKYNPHSQRFISCQGSKWLEPQKIHTRYLF
ncbi:MAG: hypothetical protein WC628_09645, partial [Candidatus Omnitrophota bacterium]